MQMPAHMKRDALSTFLRTLVISALPIAAAACCSDRRELVFQRVDAFSISDGGVGDGGALPSSLCGEVCTSSDKTVYGCSIAEQTDAGITAVDCDEQVTKCTPIFAAGGRPPLGLRARRPIDAADPAGAFFAAMAHVEAAAVDGFDELAAALAAHGAPSVLVADARGAAADEARHARVAAAFARRFGAAAPPPVEIDAVAAPSLETLALANAREGCVLETWGAVVTAWQAHSAADRPVRRAFGNIARDELRHAELAFAVARWLQSRLSLPARRRVREARRAAAAELALQVERPAPPRLAATLGLPGRDAARGLVARMRPRLWA